MRRAANLSLDLFFLVSLVLIFALVIDWFNPWALAAECIRVELAQNPDLEMHLQTYGTLAREWKEGLRLPTDCAKVVIWALDSRLVAIAGGHDMLSSLAGQLPGGQILLNLVEEAARTLVGLDRELTGLVHVSGIAQDLADLSGGADLSPEKLVTLSSSCQDGATYLAAVDEHVVNLANDIENLRRFEASHSILTTLETGRYSWGGFLGEFAGYFHDATSAWLDIGDDLQVIHRALVQDIDLEDI
jgi:hypothetical protein